ncbi:hypothetical protein BST61_g1736 [Cercospora zeina]
MHDGLIKFCVLSGVKNRIHARLRPVEQARRTCAVQVRSNLLSMIARGHAYPTNQAGIMLLTSRAGASTINPSDPPSQFPNWSSTASWPTSHCTYATVRHR